MKTNFIYSTNYHDALEQVIAKINARKVDLRIRHLLIVPERYTLLAEQMLYARSEGSFDVEVLSPSRLFYRMDLPMPLLSREGAIMLIRGMLPSLELKCFGKSAFYRGFCEKLYDAINDFAANKVAPSDIPESTPKLIDLKNIYSEYLRRISGKYVDSMGKLKLIANGASTSEYLDNVHIYVANFDYIDGATREVFDALKNRALSYTECRVEGENAITSKTERFVGEGALAVKEVAKRLRYAAYKGIKYEEMAVITGNVDNSRIKRIFAEFDVPCFIAGSKDLSDFALPAFITKLFECAVRKNRPSFLELSKNIYSGIDKESADKFENYVNSRLVDYKGFYVEFDDPVCEKVRKKLVSVVNIVESRIKTVTDARGLKALISDIISAVNAEAITEEAFGGDAQIDKLYALTELMEQVGIRGSFDFVSAVFAEGLKSAKMSRLPYAGGVTVGDPAAFRGGKYKYLAVIGFDDGVLPQIYDDSSLIGDDEKTLFTQMERTFQINGRYEYELRAVLSSAQEIFVTYTKPSGLAEELFGGSDKNVARDDVFESGCFKHAVELLFTLKRRTELAGEDNSRLLNALFAATDSKDDLFLSPRVGFVHNAEKLFFPLGSTSISQLQCYFGCPLKHFFDYGLRLRERDKGKITPLDIGSFLHLIVERIVRGGDYTNIEKQVADIIEGLDRNEKLLLEANAQKLRELKTEAVEAIKIYTSHLQKGKFVPIGEEMKFEMQLGGVKLIGKIDMADEYNGYIRLIDYKTGDCAITCSDVYYGRKIQLPIYMAATTGYKRAAMFNYPLSYKWLSSRFDHRFSGFLLSDEDIIRAVDDYVGESEVFNLKDGQKSNNSLVSAQEMDAIVDYAVKIGEKAIGEIKDGYVAASSLKDESCSYCDYACLCAEKRTRETADVKKSVFTECSN